MSAADVSSARFRAAREDDWTRLEGLLARIERGAAASLTDEDLFELPVLYRATLSSLSVARETSLDVDLVAYLESLSTRAYFILYGVHAPVHQRLLGFFASDWPLAVRAMLRETLVALLLTLVGAVAAYLLVRGNPDWFYSMVSGDMAGGRTPSASVAQLRDTLYGTPDSVGMDFAAYLFTHNAGVALMCFAFGFAFGVPTAMLLVINGCVLGAFFAVFVPKGLGLEFAAWLSIHGTTELLAIILAGAAGLRIGMATAFPGRRTRMASAIAAGRPSAFVMLGVVVMLAIAGVLEGIGRQVVNDGMVRATIGSAMLLSWLVYFYAIPLSQAAVRND